jgi:O-antigen ligase
MWSEYIVHYDIQPYFFRDIYGKIFSYHVIDPHNLYLLMWLDYGILGLVFYIIILYLVFKKGIEVLKTSSSRLLRNLSLAAVISLTVWISMSFFTMRFISDSIVIPLVFWSIIAFIIKLNSINSRQPA